MITQKNVKRAMMTDDNKLKISQQLFWNDNRTLSYAMLFCHVCHVSCQFPGHYTIIPYVLRYKQVASCWKEQKAMFNVIAIIFTFSTMQFDNLINRILWWRWVIKYFVWCLTTWITNQTPQMDCFMKEITDSFINPFWWRV